MKTIVIGRKDMRNAKKALLLLLAETISANGIELITNGLANFRIVLGEKISDDVRKAIDLEILPALKKKNINPH